MNDSVRLLYSPLLVSSSLLANSEAEQLLVERGAADTQCAGRLRAVVIALTEDFQQTVVLPLFAGLRERVTPLVHGLAVCRPRLCAAFRIAAFSELCRQVVDDLFPRT